MKLPTLALAAMLVAIAAGCGGSEAARVVTVTAPAEVTAPVPEQVSTPEPASPVEDEGDAMPIDVYPEDWSCTVGQHGQDVRLTFDAGVDSYSWCQEAIRGYSGHGSFWRHLGSASAKAHPPYGLTSICVLVSPEGAAALVEVEDAGSATLGSTICGDFAARGWTELAH